MADKKKAKPAEVARPAEESKPAESAKPAEKAKADAKAKPAPKKKGGFFAAIKRFFDRIVKYLRDTRAELKKVVWPTRKETINNTAVVLVVVAISAVFMLILDLGFGGIINLLIGA